jgi:photosystem II stability/assembly factor-like uncharacterized protein
MGSDTIVMTGLNTRVWYVEGGVHPTRPPILLTLGKFGTDPAQKIGDAKKIGAPDPNNFQRDIQVGVIAGAEDRATFGISVYTTAQKSTVLSWLKKKCRVDVFALTGRCGNPQDFTDGGEKWYYFPDGQIGGHGFEGFGAWSRDENKATDEKVDFTSAEYWEFLYMPQEQIGSSVTARQIYTVDVYVGNDCEDCPEPCDRVLATMAGASATPGTQPILLYSPDGGDTWSQQTITTLYSNEEVSDGEPIGGDMVYVSNTSNSIHWTDIEMIYDGTNVWNEVVNGFVKNKGPRAIWSADARHTFIVGDGGYIYFAQNYKVGVTVMDAGVATTQNLLAVHAMDANNILAVGNSNAVVYSKTGGNTWNTVVGPAVGVNLGACWMWDQDTWFAGEGAGGTGKLWLTTNQGKSWSQVGLPAAYSRIYKIRFVSEAEGYLLATQGTQTYVLRTITAGNEWVVLPQGKQAHPVNNTALTDVAVCSRYSNTAFAAGISASGSAGIILRMTA